MAANDLFFEMRQHFSNEEIQGLTQRFQQMTAGQRMSDQERMGQAELFFRDSLRVRQNEEKAALQTLRSDPNFQRSTVSEAIGAPFDPTKEFMSPREAMEMQASPLFERLIRGYLGPLAGAPTVSMGDEGLEIGWRPMGPFQGGSMDIQGQFLDVQERYPGRDVRIIPVPSGSGMEPVVVVQNDEGEFVPANMPGASMADAGAMFGDLFSLETLGSLLPYMGPIGGKLIARAFKSGFGAFMGGAADEGFQASQHEIDDLSVLMQNMGTRGMFGGIFAAGGEFAGAALGAGAQAVFKGATIPSGSGERAAIERAREIEGMGAPVFAGQVTPASWTARMRARWAQLDASIREQSLRQTRWLGRNQQEIADEFLRMDGVDQAIATSGMSLTTLDQAEREIASQLSRRAQEQLGAIGTTSRDEAGRLVKEAIGDLTDKEMASYRMLGYAKMNEMENVLLDIVDDSAPFSIDTMQLRRTAREALSHMDILQQQTGRVAQEIGDGAGEELLGVGVSEVRRKFAKDLRFVLETLDRLPDEALSSRGVYEVTAANAGDLMQDRFRVDGMGNIRTTYQQTAQQGQEVGYFGRGGGQSSMDQVELGPVIGTYEVNGVETLRMLRGKLRDYFDNPLLPTSDSDAKLAKKLYLQIGEALENTTDGAFNQAVRSYNAESSRILGTLDQLKTAGFLREGNGQALVTQFTDGSMGFESLSTLRNALSEAGERGANAWEGYRNSVIRDFLNNPDKIKNLDIEPATSGLVLRDSEMQVLRDYGTQMEILNRQGPRAVGARAAGTRGRSLALFRSIPDNEMFGRLWSNMSETDRNVMRYSVVQDLLDSATHVRQGEPNVLVPQTFAENLQKLFAGDTGDRLRMILPKDAIDKLSDGQQIAAFYADVLRHVDLGASMGAAEDAMKVQRELMSRSLTGVLSAGLNVKLNQMAAVSLVDGVLGKILKPRVAEPNKGIYVAQSLMTMGATMLNANNMVADADPKFDERMEEALRKAMREEASRRVRRGSR
jgi:hypothetical protein